MSDQALVVKPPEPTPPSEPATGRWTLGDYVGLVGGVIGIVGAITGLLGWNEAKESRKIAAEAQVLSQKTYDRAAGRIGAKFTLLGVKPEQRDIPAAFKFNLGELQDEIRVRSLDQLGTLNPRLEIENTGDEAIESIRVETRFDLLGVRFEGNPKEREWGFHKEWRVAHVVMDEYPLGRKLMPKERASVPMIRGLLTQMLKIQQPDTADKDHYGRFEINCFGRIVGATAFDDGYREPRIYIRFAWIPKGFNAEECKKFLDEDRIGVSIGEKKKLGD